jgi:hypothetical protein
MKTTVFTLVMAAISTHDRTEISVLQQKIFAC